MTAKMKSLRLRGRLGLLLELIAVLAIFSATADSFAVQLQLHLAPAQRTPATVVPTSGTIRSKTSLPSFRRTTCLAMTSENNSAEKINESASGGEVAVADLEALSSALNAALERCKSDVVKTQKVKVAPVGDGNYRLGLVATQNLGKNDVALAVPFDAQWELTADVARKVVFQGILSDSYDGWTGETGLIALMILNELARTANAGIAEPKRSNPIQEFMSAWVQSLPSYKEMVDDKMHPLLWPEEDQEALQSASTNKIYRLLDDVEEDALWLTENVFEKDRTRFPETINGAPCFSVQGYTWAMAIAKSRSIFVQSALRLLPIIDFCNHDDDDTNEISVGSMGAFGTVRGAQLLTARSYKAGEQVFCSYGPKSAADYMLDHGFIPQLCFRTSVSELTFSMEDIANTYTGEAKPGEGEKSPNGGNVINLARFLDDKMDILEFETYDQAPMDPTQSFDVVSAVGRDGEPDPAMMQFLRLCYLGGTDAFLLEAVFRKEVWDFMSLPVSERNELAVVSAIATACNAALEDLEAPGSEPESCTKLRESERRALQRTLEFVQREKEALDLKEYYQERRLKDLGLDSEWTPEDEDGDFSADLSFGQTRTPGGADYDW